MGNPKF